MEYNMNKKTMLTLLLLIFAINTTSFAQGGKDNVYGIDMDTVQAKQFDMGKMWTFENPPLDYFEKTYGFRPTEEWLEHARTSALKLAYWCSASFVSEDGLIMTNHHCVRGDLAKVELEGENLLKDGFWAETLEDERPMPDYFVEQLVVIKDVTEEIHKAMESGTTDEEKITLKNDKVDEIIEKHSAEQENVIFKVTSLYNGGKYSLYGYKRYSDIRLIFVPDLMTAKLGGDYDNFTYPRYGLDCAFLRAYDEDGKPLKTPFHFKWNPEGAKEGDAVFVVGNPGSTSRIYTMAQIEFERDVQYPLLVKLLTELYAIHYKIVEETNAEDFHKIARLYSVGNGLKVYSGTYKALLDPVLMARKKDFEEQFKAKVAADPELKEKYYHIWDEIEKLKKEEASFFNELFAYGMSSYYTPEYFYIAKDLIQLAKELQKDENERDETYKGENLEMTIEELFPEDFNSELEEQLLLVNVNKMLDNLPEDSPIRTEIFNGLTGEEAAEYVLEKTKLKTKEGVIEFAKQSPEEILNSKELFIQLYQMISEKSKELKERTKEIDTKETVYKQQLGKALFAVYGESIPPDATFTLRLADGVVKGYDYNGTRAPVKTTFYGSLDRYYAFDGKFPYNLPDIWKDLPEAFDPSTPLDFISTNDIVGGNSGSPVINTKGEIVGLAFDGNIESLPGRFIYTTEANRTVNVHSAGMLEAIRDLYGAKRLADEIINGKIK